MFRWKWQKRDRAVVLPFRWVECGLFKRRFTLTAFRGVDEVGQEKKEVRSNRLKKVRGDMVSRTGGNKASYITVVVM